MEVLLTSAQGAVQIIACAVILIGMYFCWWVFSRAEERRDRSETLLIASLDKVTEGMYRLERRITQIEFKIVSGRKHENGVHHD